MRSSIIITSLFGIFAVLPVRILCGLMRELVAVLRSDVVSIVKRLIGANHCKDCHGSELQHKVTRLKIMLPTQLF